MQKNIGAQERRSGELPTSCQRAVLMAFRCTTAEVYDLAWSPTGEYIIAGSTDNTARVFSAADGSCVREIAEHSHYVQGVAWDPMNEFFATQSSDRAVHIYSVSAKHGHFEAHAVGRNTRMQMRHVRTPSRSRSAAGAASDAESAAGDDAFDMPPPRGTSSRRSSFSGSQAAPSPRASPAPLPAIRPWVKLYGDESYTNFYRRLTFSPDGALLLTPAGLVEDPAVVPGRLSPAASTVMDTAGTSSVFVYTRANLTRPPVAQLPGFKKPTIAVRFSPVLYELRGHAHVSEEKEETKEVHIGKETDTVVDVNLLGAGAVSEGATPIALLPSPRASTPSVPPTGAVFALPYRMLYSVASMDSVAIYDTQQAAPVALLARLHYDEFTDMAWSPDGRALVMSARDGYCTVAVLDERVPLHHTQQPALQLQSLAAHSFGQNQPGSLVVPSAPLTSFDVTQPRSLKRPISPAPSVAPEQDAPPPAKKRRAALTHHGQDTT